MTKEEIIKKVRKIEIITNKKVNNAFVGNFRSAFYGNGIEFADIREYDSSDDYKNIDWQTTAKQGKPFVKRYVENKERKILVIVDNSKSMSLNISEKSKIDVAVEIVATILFSIYKSNNYFGLLAFSNNIDLYLPPKKGKNHLLRCLTFLIDTINQETKSSSSQKNALAFVSKCLKKKTFCFFLSDRIDSNIENDLKIINKKHIFTFIRINNPIEQGIDLPSQVLSIEDIDNPKNQMIINFKSSRVRNKFVETRQAKIKQENNFLNKNKIDCLNILTTDNHYEKVFKFFSDKSK